MSAESVFDALAQLRAALNEAVAAHGFASRIRAIQRETKAETAAFSPPGDSLTTTRMSTRHYRKTGPTTTLSYWCGPVMVGWCLVIFATLYAIAVVAQHWWEILAGIMLVLVLAMVGVLAAAKYAYQRETWRMGPLEYRCTKRGHLLSADRKRCPIDGSPVKVADFRRQRGGRAPKTRAGTRT